MPRILYNPETTELIRWPRLDEEDVVGLEPPVIALGILQEAKPDFDPEFYGLVATEDVDLTAGLLRRGWELVPVAEPAAVPRWVQFAGALAADADVRDLLWEVEAANPVLRSMLGVGLGQAAQGAPETFLAAWGQAVASGLVPSGLPAQMAGLAAAFDLPAAFVEGLG